MFLKGANCPGAIVRKDLSLEARKADVEGRILDQLKASQAAIKRDLDNTRLALAARRWRHMHSL